MDEEVIEETVAEVEEQIEQAALSVIQGVDAPVAPGSQASYGYMDYKSGRTKEMRIKYRKHLINLSKDEIAKVAKEEILDRWESSVKVSCAGAEVIKQEKTDWPVSSPLK